MCVLHGWSERGRLFLAVSIGTEDMIIGGVVLYMVCEVASLTLFIIQCTLPTGSGAYIVLSCASWLSAWPVLP